MRRSRAQQRHHTHGPNAERRLSPVLQISAGRRLEGEAPGLSRHRHQRRRRRRLRRRAAVDTARRCLSPGSTLKCRWRRCRLRCRPRSRSPQRRRERRDRTAPRRWRSYHTGEGDRHAQAPADGRRVPGKGLEPDDSRGAALAHRRPATSSRRFRASAAETARDRAARPLGRPQAGRRGRRRRSSSC